MTAISPEGRPGVPPLFPRRILDRLKPPGGLESDELTVHDGALRCERTGARYPLVDGVPSLLPTDLRPDDEITSKIKAFYEQNPFPSYEGVEEFGELVNKGSRNPFSAQLLRAIGFNKLILECGCGTGQLSHFLQINNNQVLGVDLSLSSLRLAVDHKQRNRLHRCSFARMNLFELAIKDNSFDVVISHGVLHHTRDPRLAFAQIVRKAKPGGIVMVGLYNSYARVLTWLRAKLIGLCGPQIDYVVRNRIRDRRKADIWIKDQYYNPHETWHTIDEVLAWFEENDVEYLNCSPPILGTDGEEAENLFASTSPGNAYQRIVTQMSWLGTIAREGSLFDVIGRKRSRT